MSMSLHVQSITKDPSYQQSIYVTTAYVRKFIKNVILVRVFITLYILVLLSWKKTWYSTYIKTLCRLTDLFKSNQR